jgi:hypothetical protein
VYSETLEYLEGRDTEDQVQILKVYSETMEYLEGHDTEDQVQMLNGMRRKMDLKIYDLWRDITGLKEDIKAKGLVV